MNKKFKQEIIKLGVVMLFAAIISCFILPVPLLPDGLRQIVLLVTIIVYPLCCFWVLVRGSWIIWALSCKKFFRWLIFIAWLFSYALLCWVWTTLVILVMMQIFGDV